MEFFFTITKKKDEESVPADPEAAQEMLFHTDIPFEYAN